MKTIDSEKTPVFKYKLGKKPGGNAEKFFSPNLEYIKGGMKKKGNRNTTIKINLHPNVLQDLLYNPTFAGVDKDASDDFLKKRKIKRVDTENSIIIKTESNQGMKTVSQNFGFRLKGGKLVDLAKYIISIFVLGDNDFEHESNFDPVTSLEGFKPELPPRDEEDGESMRVEGDLFTIEDRTYDITSNRVQSGSCLWALLKAAGIPEEVLEQAAETAKIRYNDFVEVDKLKELIQEINKLYVENQLTLRLDVFSYEGIYYRNRGLIAGNGENQITIGLVFDNFGLGH